MEDYKTVSFLIFVMSLRNLPSGSSCSSKYTIFPASRACLYSFLACCFSLRAPPIASSPFIVILKDHGAMSAASPNSVFSVTFTAFDDSRTIPPFVSLGSEVSIVVCSRSRARFLPLRRHQKMQHARRAIRITAPPMAPPMAAHGGALVPSD